MQWRHEKCYICLINFNAKKSRLFPFSCDHSICNSCFKTWCDYMKNRNEIKCGMCKCKLKKKALICTNIMTIKISNKDSISIFYCEGKDWKYYIRSYFFNYPKFIKSEMEDNVQKYIIEAQLRK